MTTPSPTPPGDDVTATFAGVPLRGAPGASVAAALIANGHHSWRDTRSGASRGLFCGIGVCFDCLVEIDGESGQRACMVPLAEGMEIRRATGALRETGSAGAAPAEAPATTPDEPQEETGNE